MELFKANNNLCQDFCGLFDGKHFVLEFGLIINEITSVAVFEEKVDVGLILSNLVEFDDVWRIHRLHALDFSV